MTLNYRSLFETPADVDPLERLQSHFRGWLQSKRDDVRSRLRVGDWDGPGVHEIGEDCTVTEVDDISKDGSRLLRLRLEERNEGGTWVTEATGAERPGSESWTRFIWVETSNDDPEGRDPQPPRLVRSLLGDFDGLSSKAQLSSRPVVVRGADQGDVDRLIEQLEDLRRTVPIVVGVAFEGMPVDRWVEMLDRLTRPGIGLLSAVVVDPDAATQLNEWLGDTHQVSPGGVRTFYPGVRPDDDRDSYRHRYITPGTLADTVERRASGVWVRPALANALAWNARRSVIEAGLPKQVRRVDTLLRRAQVAMTAAAPSPLGELRRIEPGSGTPLDVAESPRKTHAVTSPTPSLPSLIQLGEFVKELFGADVLTDDLVVRFCDIVAALAGDVATLQAEADVYEQSLDEATEDNKQLHNRLEEAELAAAVADDERRAAERTASWYVKQLKAVQRYDLLAVPDEPSAPQNLGELIDRLQDPGHRDRHPLLSRVAFTGDIESIDALMPYDTLGRVAAAAWDVLLVLGDYVDAKLAEENPPANVYEYLRVTPPGRKAISSQKFVPTESSTVAQNPDWRRERTFRVPDHIDSSGRIYMDAHFRLRDGDTVAPRLYLHDAVDTDGNVYVGYIGRHLTNTLT